MRDIIKKIIFFILYYLVYYNICFLLIIPEIFNNLIYLIALILNYLVSLIDTLIRPISKKRQETKKYVVILLILFFLSPFLLSLAYYENIIITSRYVPVWDNEIVSYLGIIIFIIGSIIVLTSRFQLGKYGGGRLVIEEEHKLITTGLYKHIRHPMYLGGMIGAFGLGLVFRALIMPIVYFFITFFEFKARMDYEEQILISEFGEEYQSYMKRTKRLIPYIY